MSLTNVKWGQIVKKQYVFKCRSYSGMFLSLMGLQLLAILLSVTGGSGRSSGNDNLNVDVTYVSANSVIVFTMIWALISAILITTRIYKEEEFTFITNRLSNNVANMAFLVTCSVIGGVTAYLSSFVVRAIVQSTSRATLLSEHGLTSSVTESIGAFSAPILYVLLCCAVGYFIGTLIQLHRIFIIMLPAGFVSTLILSERFGNKNITLEVSEFYFQESSPLLFFIKVMVTVLLLFGGAIILSNQQEVKV